MFAENFIQLSQVKLHYIYQGEGDKLVILLHGFPEFCYSWHQQIPVLANNNFFVVAPDLRGFNLSSKPRSVREYRIDKVASDIAELIEQLGYDSAYIVGHDFGGYVAWHLAGRYPHLVKKLVLLNSPHPAKFFKNYLINPVQFFLSWYILPFQLPVIPEFLLSIDLEYIFRRAFRKFAFNTEHFTDEHIARYVAAYSQPHAFKSAINYQRTLLRYFNVFINVPEIKAPTLMLWGENDFTLIKKNTEGTQKFVKNSFKLHLIPDCSHWIQQDSAQIVNQYLINFLT